MSSNTEPTRSSLASRYRSWADSTRVAMNDVGQGLMLVSHNALAMVGLLVIGAAIVGLSRPDIRNDVEVWVLDHLQSRQLVGSEAVVDSEVVAARIDVPVPVLVGDATAVSRATATDPDDLSNEQANIAKWLARRYKVAPEPIGRLVQEAWDVGQRFKLDPTLILAIMAVESSFNPFAQSSVGAQGLMQVMTNVHDKKYEPFGGVHAAFDPITNLKVGVQVLKECIARAGSLHEGLRHYVGAANLPNDSGYAGKVLGEQAHLLKVAAGKAVAHTAPIVPVPVPVKAAPTGQEVLVAPTQSGSQVSEAAAQDDAATTDRTLLGARTTPVADASRAY